MLAVVDCAATFGVEAILVRVEVDISDGLPGFATVGLPESSVREARVRVQAAIENSGFSFPTGRITVNLAPANVKKEGTGFDLAIALGLLGAAGELSGDKLKSLLVLGELSLTGAVKPIRGVLAATELARKRGQKQVIVPEKNAGEAALVEGIEVRSVKGFAQLMDFLLSGNEDAAPIATPVKQHAFYDAELDMADVRGQHHAKRALEIAAAGGHNILLIGGPGSGKTMMARRLPTILPPMSYQEALEVTRIHSTLGLTLGGGLVKERPFRSPHHSTTKAGLIGGGSGIPRPGELSLATNGVLFLDELPEFPRQVLEVLRQPLESGEVILSRANATLVYPARVMLVAAMNPCPCGNFGCEKRVCRCSSWEISRYRSKLSGPLLDRIDLHVEVPAVPITDLQSVKRAESSEEILKRVKSARLAQATRLNGFTTNATMARSQLVKTASPTKKAQDLLACALDKFGLSARAYDRIIRVARTIADLHGAREVEARFVAEAIQYRGDKRMLLAA